MGHVFQFGAPRASLGTRSSRHNSRYLHPISAKKTRQNEARKAQVGHTHIAHAPGSRRRHLDTLVNRRREFQFRVLRESARVSARPAQPLWLERGSKRFWRDRECLRQSPGSTPGLASPTGMRLTGQAAHGRTKRNRSLSASGGGGANLWSVQEPTLSASRSLSAVRHDSSRPKYSPLTAATASETTRTTKAPTSATIVSTLQFLHRGHSKSLVTKVSR